MGTPAMEQETERLRSNAATAADDVRLRLVEAAGRLSQDLGLGRLFGQLLGYLYLHKDPCSLDDICVDLAISKASASIGARQLERLGLIVRAWVQGDRKTYYRTADNIVTALQHGLSGFLSQKMGAVGAELVSALNSLGPAPQDQDGEFLQQRLSRANDLCIQLSGLLSLFATMNPAAFSPAQITLQSTKT